MEAALEAGAGRLVTFDDGAIDVYTAWEEMGAVRDALEAAGLKAAEVSMIPSTKVDMTRNRAKLLRLIDMLGRRAEVATAVKSLTRLLLILE